MASFTTQEIIAATKAECIKEGTTVLFTGVSTDTRTLQPGDVFIALIGENFNGHQFIAQAIKKGAKGIIVSTITEKMEGVAVYKVDNTLRALEQLAAFHRQKFSIPLIAVTGSNGKTTTKDITSHILSSRYHVLKTQANFNNEIGLSQTLLSLNEHHQVAVVEMGMRAKGEIEHLTKIAKPTIGIVTTVGETHMELLGSLENIAAAKAELVAALPEDGLAILNNDNSFVAAMRVKARCAGMTFGIDNPSDVRAENVVTGGMNIAFQCVYSQGRFMAMLPLIGRHNVYNSLAAVAVGIKLGLTAAEITAGLTSVSLTRMRQSIEKYGEYTIINDAYNASPMSMAAAIDTLVEVADQRKVAVLGDMLELGRIAEEAHQRIGRKLAGQGIEIVITLGELSKNIAQSAREYGVKNVISCVTHEEVEQALKRLLKPGDTILLKGSRGMRMEKVLEMFQ